jgi:GcrA cell cycle regulator
MPKGHYDRSGNTVWTAELVERLRELWPHELGHSTKEIGRLLGQSKNSVVGKAHRLGLPPRPSPIVRDTLRPSVRRLIARPAGPTLAPLSTPPVVLREPLPPLRAESPKPKPIALFGRVTECCFPEGEPGTRGFHYCDAPTMPGAIYCATHHARGHVRQHVRDPSAPAAHETPSRFSFARHGGE